MAILQGKSFLSQHNKYIIHSIFFSSWQTYIYLIPTHSCDKKKKIFTHFFFCLAFVIKNHPINLFLDFFVFDVYKYIGIDVDVKKWDV